MILGIDVSENNGVIDWSRVAASKPFAIIKATEGTFRRDSLFSQNYSQAQRYGVYRGAYHFAHPSQDADSQAAFFVLFVQSQGGFELPPVLDLELIEGQSDSALVAFARAWGMKATQLTGRRPILYSSSSFITEHGLHVLSDQFDLWVADWLQNGPPDPSGWPSWMFWQQSESGSVPGISGNVDTDFFNGTIDDLKKLCGGVNNVLQLGSTGDAVKQLQTDLNKVLGVHLTEDGNFGPATQAAVKSFEQIYGLPVDGVAGPQVLAKLTLLVAPPKPTPQPAPKPQQTNSEKAVELLNQAIALLKGGN